MCGTRTLRSGLLASLLGARKLLRAPGRTTRNKKLLGAKGIATRSKEATRGSLPLPFLFNIFCWTLGEWQVLHTLLKVHRVDLFLEETDLACKVIFVLPR